MDISTPTCRTVVYNTLLTAMYIIPPTLTCTSGSRLRASLIPSELVTHIAVLLARCIPPAGCLQLNCRLVPRRGSGCVLRCSSVPDCVFHNHFGRTFHPGFITAVLHGPLPCFDNVAILMHIKLLVAVYVVSSQCPRVHSLSHVLLRRSTRGSVSATGKASATGSGGVQASAALAGHVSVCLCSCFVPGCRL